MPSGREVLPGRIILAMCPGHKRSDLAGATMRCPPGRVKTAPCWSRNFAGYISIYWLDIAFFQHSVKAEPGSEQTWRN